MSRTFGVFRSVSEGTVGGKQSRLCPISILSDKWRMDFFGSCISLIPGIVVPVPALTDRPAATDSQRFSSDRKRGLEL